MTGWAGHRSATVGSPALTACASPQSSRRGGTIVSAPGQNAAASAWARVERGELLGGGQIGHMDDQRVEIGAPLAR
jgi:hypothetical protein